ncbi:MULTISPECIES: RloB family protein [Actinomyces]|uniref:RloB domain-containing protein n=1 Tax=Actinomyces respiraculi TaxID=2744574 RepID=A0A7T0LKB4_9ACTO|nr:MULTISPECIES: RloB family protein [Actinomyces]QPL05250.1 RloB domain-containing protein [Actinomyces respiraculi]
MPPRQRRGRKRQEEERRTVLLVTNGRTTETAYFAGLGRHVDRKKYSVTSKFINGDPLTLTKDLKGDRWDLSAYTEVWIVVDHDGIDRQEFLKECRGLCSRRTVVHGIVSVPCFEVWLNAHYAPVRNYQNQTEAQAHYRALTGLSTKNLPADFPWDAMSDAAHRCHLPTVSEPAIDTQGPCPSTTMPHLLRRLGLL